MLKVAFFIANHYDLLFFCVSLQRNMVYFTLFVSKRTTKHLSLT